MKSTMKAKTFKALVFPEAFAPLKHIAVDAFKFIDTSDGTKSFSLKSISIPSLNDHTFFAPYPNNIMTPTNIILIYGTNLSLSSFDKLFYNFQKIIIISDVFFFVVKFTGKNYEFTAIGKIVHFAPHVFTDVEADVRAV